MNATYPIGVRAKYKLIRRKAVTDEFGNRVAGAVVEETPWTKNLLTYQYFNDALTVSTLLVRGMAVGTGNTAPAVGQTSLTSFLAATTTRQDFVATMNPTDSPRSVTKTFRYRFAEGVAAGNVAEVGMFTSASTGTNAATAISSRALVTDAFGVPTAITVLSDEFLDVIWECTWYVPEDVTGTTNISIDGVPTAFNWTVRAIAMNTGATRAFWHGEVIGVYFNSSYLNTSPGWQAQATDETTLRAYDSVATTGESATNAVSGITHDAYTPNSKNRNFRFTWGLDRANISFRSFAIRAGWNGTQGVFAMGCFQVLLNNPITKVNTKSFTLILNIALDNVP